ncbi:MAG: TonB-dependent receptor, partial [Pseudomonadales bacterium]|nr:TonB-dependent receptor [Pseudomonadales bacterium]
VNELFDANSEQARRIEVIKGPAGVLYGSNGMHGMVNVITPSVTPVRQIGLDVGPHDYYRINGSLGNDAMRLDANGTSDGGYKDDSGFDQQKATFKSHYNWRDFDVTSAISATNLNQETAGYIEGFESYKDDAVRKSNPNPEAYRDTWSARAWSRFQKEHGDTRFVITPYLRKTGMRFIQHFLPGQAIEENGQESVGVQSAWYLEDLTFGVDTEFTRGFLKETQPGPTTGSAFLVATIPEGDHYDYDVDAFTLAGFVQRRFHPTDRVELIAGLRAEHVGYRYDNHLPDGRTRDDGTPCGFGGCRFSRPADRHDNFNNFSPKLGLHYALSPTSQAYAYLSRGFRAPETTELYRLQGDQDVANIDSERLDSLEIGLRGDTGPLSYDLATYVMRKDNFIFRDNDRRNVDNGKTSHKGIEFDLAWTIGDTLTASLDWTYAIHQYENNPALASVDIEGNDIDTAPRNLGSIRLAWRPLDTLSGEIEIAHVGRYFEDPENEHPYAGHNLVTLRMQYRPTDQLATWLRVTNLTDTLYAERADYAFGVDRYFVGEPRSLYLGISFEVP